MLRKICGTRQTYFKESCFFQITIPPHKLHAVVLKTEKVQSVLEYTEFPFLAVSNNFDEGR
jgi:hypothetical protein